MNLKKTSLQWTIGLLLWLTVAWGNLQAHTMWIETPFAGRVGEPQTVKIYFGEYSLRMISETRQWFSNIADCELKLLAPDGSTVELEKTRADSCYTAAFTPQAEGWYLLYFEQVVRDLYEGMHITYQAQAWVKVGQPAGLPEVKSPFSTGRLILPPMVPFRLGESAEVRLTEGGMPATSRRFTLTSDNGWRKNLRTDAVSGSAATPLIFPAHFLYEWTEQIEVKEEAKRLSPEHRSEYINLCYWMEAM